MREQELSDEKKKNQLYTGVLIKNEIEIYVVQEKSKMRKYLIYHNLLHLKLHIICNCRQEKMEFLSSLDRNLLTSFAISFDFSKMYE